MPADVAFYTDPRVRMRDALRTLVRAGDTWGEPTLEIFRNRLLDITGSDARPLAELLVEALRRGWRERMREQPLSTAAWDALVAPFIMHWSAERFVQPDMARWAVECWGFAFGVIRDDQLRIAPVRARAPADGRRVVAGATPASPGAPTPPARTPAPPPTMQTATYNATSHAMRNAVQRAQPAARAVGARGPQAAYRSRASAARSPVRHVNPWISRVLLAVLATSGLGLVTYVSMTANSQSPPLSRTAPASRASTPSPPATARPAPQRPGVPSVTIELSARAVADSARMLFVEPARRASGNSGLVTSAPPGVAVGLDQIRLADGTRMLGRVEVLRAGSVMFRDVTTGLRHEIAKDDVDEIVTEFGTSVRFGDSNRGRAAGVSGSSDIRRATTVPATRETGPRMRGVGGRYVIRYAAATANGSRECTSVWQRAPNTADRATVQHRPGADTLSVVFDGGDTFQSNIDRQGYFASTFRIVPDQARSSTALTTRLNGQFTDDGALAMQVNIVFFRRMRSGGDIACNVTVNATGTRER